MVGETVTDLEQKHLVSTSGDMLASEQEQKSFDPISDAWMLLTVHGLALGGPVRSRELHWMILMGPSQLEILYSSMSEGGRRCSVLVYPAFSLSVARARSSPELGAAARNCFQGGLSAPVSLV